MNLRTVTWSPEPGDPTKGTLHLQVDEGGGRIGNHAGFFTVSEQNGVRRYDRIYQFIPLSGQGES